MNNLLSSFDTVKITNSKSVYIKMMIVALI